MAKPKGFFKEGGKTKPISQKKGISESDMNISVKGNDDTIVVGTKKPTGGMKGNREKNPFQSEHPTKGHIPDVNLYHNNWSLTTENGKIKSVGLDGGGWSWNDDGSGLNLFLIRLARSKADDDFIETMNKNGITFEMFKPIMLKSLEGNPTKEGNGLYAFTGDNRRWQFGDEIDETAEADEILNELEDRGTITKEQKEELSNKLWTEYSGVSYEDFIKKHGLTYRDNLVDIIKRNNDFNDFFHDVNEWEKVRYNMAEDYITMTQGAIYDAIRTVSIKEKIPISV